MGAECGFETKQQLNDYLLRFPWSEYPLPPLHRACRDGDMLSLTYLTVQGDRLEVFRSINEQDQFLMWTPAHWAAYFGKTECVQRLVDCGMNIDVSEGRLKQSPTHLAAFAGHARLLQWLLQKGALADKVDSLGETPVHKAARGGNTECLSLLQAFGIPLSTFNSYRQTPCDVATSLGFEQCVLFLRSHSCATVSNQRKCKRLLDDGDHEGHAKRPRNDKVHHVNHEGLLDSDGMNHSLFLPNGTSPFSNGFVTNKVNGENHFTTTQLCAISENSEMDIPYDDIPDTREVKYTVQYLNHPSRCLSLCGHMQ